jgi:hypothetical protein
VANVVRAILGRALGDYAGNYRGERGLNGFGIQLFCFADWRAGDATPGATGGAIRILVSAGIVALPITPFRTERVAAPQRADDSERLNRNAGAEKRDAENPGHRHRAKLETGGWGVERRLYMCAASAK